MESSHFSQEIVTISVHLNCRSSWYRVGDVPADTRVRVPSPAHPDLVLHSHPQLTAVVSQSNTAEAFKGCTDLLQMSHCP